MQRSMRRPTDTDEEVLFMTFKNSQLGAYVIARQLLVDNT